MANKEFIDKVDELKKVYLERHGIKLKDTEIHGALKMDYTSFQNRKHGRVDDVKVETIKILDKAIAGTIDIRNVAHSISSMAESQSADIQALKDLLTDYKELIDMLKERIVYLENDKEKIMEQNTKLIDLLTKKS